MASITIRRLSEESKEPDHEPNECSGFGKQSKDAQRRSSQRKVVPGRLELGVCTKPTTSTVLELSTDRFRIEFGA